MAARRTTGAGAGRESKVRSRATAEEQSPAPAAPGGMGFVDAVTIATTLLLIAAILMMDKVLGEHFATGMFFKP